MVYPKRVTKVALILARCLEERTLGGVLEAVVIEDQVCSLLTLLA